MQLKQTLIIAVTLGIISLAALELYWRLQEHSPNIDDYKTFIKRITKKHNKSIFG